MRKLIANLNLKWKLIAIVLVPILCLVYFSKSEISRNVTIVDDNNRLLNLSGYARQASALVHELQKERGFTAGYMGSSGEAFGDKLTEQRAATDLQISQLTALLKDFDASDYGPELSERMQKALSELKRIDSLRSQISNFSIDPKQAIAFYTNMNAAFLHSIGYLSIASTSSDLTNMATAYLHFLLSKERAGIERAVLVGAFTVDYFKPGVYEKFLQLVTTQEVHLDAFKSMANKEQLAFLASTLSGKNVDAAQDMRTIAMERAQSGQFDVAPSDWFQAQTGKINQLKKVEDKLSQDLNQLALTLSNSASATLNKSLIVVIFSLSATLVFVFYIQRMVTGPITLAASVAESISRGKLDNNIIADTKDEAGQLLSALDTMQSNLYTAQEDIRRKMEEEARRAEQDSIAAAENSRIRQALDTVSANVMVADDELTIIYANDAALRTFNTSESSIQRDVAGFSAANLIGSNLASLHSDQVQQRTVLRNLAGTHIEEIELGDRIFNCVVNPVRDADNKRLGTVIEWTDLTEQRQAEHQIEHIIDSAVAGQLSTRLDASEFDGFTRTIAQGVNEMLDAIVGPLTTAADYVERIANGDIPPLIQEQYRGDFDHLKNNLNTCIAAIERLVNDTNGLSLAAIEGSLSTRADASAHYGDFRRIVEGINNTLDAVINPLSMAAEYIQRISRGNIPPLIHDDYQGDFNTLKTSLNTCISAVELLVQDTEHLVEAAISGDLSTRADTSKHQGDFRKIVNGVNNTLDAIVTPINECKEVMEALAKADLTKKVNGNFHGEFAVLRNAVNGSIDNLLKLVGDIRHSAQTIDVSSTSIANGNSELSRRTENQAASLEQTASSLETLTTTVNQNANNARSASDLANRTSQQAQSGGEVVGNAIAAMDAINDSSKKIADIIGVIDEIAFQTNLLALNAAVEAARAGEQGRGFAVVAAEVRNLAQRSSEAAGDIKNLITDSVDRVNEGSQLVNASGATLEKIVQSVKEVAKLISGIAEASTEQSQGISQLNDAVRHMDQITQQNSSMVDQAASTSTALTEQASGLKHLVESFVIHEHNQMVAVVPINR